MLDTLVRYSIGLDHNIWLLGAASIMGPALLITASYIRIRVLRESVALLGCLVFAFVSGTGLGPAPLDHWQHAHGSCLIDNLK